MKNEKDLRTNSTDGDTLANKLKEEILRIYYEEINTKQREKWEGLESGDDSWIKFLNLFIKTVRGRIKVKAEQEPLLKKTVGEMLVYVLWLEENGEEKENVKKWLQQTKKIKEPLPEGQPTFFPVPTKLEKKLRPIFLPRITEKDLEKEIEKEANIFLEIFKKNQNARLVYYYILKGQLETLKDTKAPSLGDWAKRCFIATIGFAIKQGTLSPRYTKSDKLKCLGYSGRELAGGQILKKVEIAEKLLAYTTYDIVDKRKGRKYKESIGHLYSHLDIYRDGRNLVFNPTLDPTTLGKDLPKLIEGKRERISYISYSRLLKDRDLTGQQRSLCAYLEGLKGYGCAKRTAKYLLLEIMGISKNYFKKRPTYCYEALVTRGLEVAKKKGYLKDYKHNYQGQPQDVREWSFELHLPHKKHLKKQEVNSLPDSLLVKRIVEWNCRNIFDTKLPKWEVERMVKNTIKTYGKETIREIFEGEANSHSPHPKNFWAKVKKLKAKRILEKSMGKR